MKKAKIKEILLEYDKKRSLAENKLEYRKKEAYRQVPKLKEIDDEIAKMGLELAKNVLFSNKEDKSKLVEDSKNEIEKLKIKKKDLVKFYNIPKNHFEIEYECNKCRDTGFLKDNQKCSCFRQKIINEAYKMSNLSRMLEVQNFENLNEELFSKEIDEKEGISPRTNILDITSICEKFILDFHIDNRQNLLFYGSTGLGKTFLSNCIAKRVLDRGYTVVYQTSFKLFEIIENYKFNKENRTDFDKDLYENIFDCDLLIIDDLGTELHNSFTNSELFNIINTRIMAGKKMIISTNLEPYQLGDLYATRIFSRIFDSFKMLKFFGKDLRWENQKDALSR